MFFLPLGMFANVPGLGWGEIVNNWVFAFLGNFVGAGIFVSTFYWYLHPRGRKESEILREEVPEPVLAGSPGGSEWRPRPFVRPDRPCRSVRTSGTVP